MWINRFYVITGPHYFGPVLLSAFRSTGLLRKKKKKSEFHTKTGFFQPERPHGQLWSADSLWAWLVFTKKVNLTRRIRTADTAVRMTSMWSFAIYSARSHQRLFAEMIRVSAIWNKTHLSFFFLSCPLKLIQRSIPFDLLSYFNSTVSYPCTQPSYGCLPAHMDMMWRNTQATLCTPTHTSRSKCWKVLRDTFHLFLMCDLWPLDSTIIKTVCVVTNGLVDSWQIINYRYLIGRDVHFGAPDVSGKILLSNANRSSCCVFHCEVKMPFKHLGSYIIK